MIEYARTDNRGRLYLVPGERPTGWRPGKPHIRRINDHWYTSDSNDDASMDFARCAGQFSIEQICEAFGVPYTGQRIVPIKELMALTDSVVRRG